MARQARLLRNTVKVHVRKDRSEIEIRFSGGAQVWDKGCVSPHMGAAKYEIEKRGGCIELRPKVSQAQWTEADQAELQFLLGLAGARG